MIHNTVHVRTARRIVLAAASVLMLGGIAIDCAGRSDAAPKFCNTQLYIHACATGHGGTTWYPTKKKDKDCDHAHSDAPVSSGIAGGAL